MSGWVLASFPPASAGIRRTPGDSPHSNRGPGLLEPPRWGALLLEQPSSQPTLFGCLMSGNSWWYWLYSFHRSVSQPAPPGKPLTSSTAKGGPQAWVAGATCSAFWLSGPPPEATTGSLGLWRPRDEPGEAAPPVETGMRWYVTLGLFEEEGLRGKAEEQKQLRPAQEAVEGLGTKFYSYSHP